MKFKSTDQFCRECGSHRRFFVEGHCPNCGGVMTATLKDVPKLKIRMLHRIYEMDVARELRRKIVAGHKEAVDKDLDTLKELERARDKWSGEQWEDKIDTT